ncbi:hypothetical protein TCDM_08285 [Trypanosoma cruzi Dm28c]|uniref:Uncharacterized protein n=1 Tax=Trypanosoma cruzi Dm28c TaxID=1416333 RepID=V5BCK9_TRYCR|nr:hypothetical protein TCDM_08285 [Trypanosoma cruzi Dm28c]
MLKLRAQSGQTDAEVIREKRSRGTSKKKKKENAHTPFVSRGKTKITGEKQQQKTKTNGQDYRIQTTTQIIKRKNNNSNNDNEKTKKKTIERGN